MFHVLGKITKRILSGEIPNDAIHPTRTQPVPKPASVKRANIIPLGGRHRKGK